MRYWPLTAVLLAFWMGRETGAGDEDEAQLGNLVGRSLTLKTADGHVWLEAKPESGGGRLQIVAHKHKAIVEIGSSDEQQYLIMEKGSLQKNTYRQQIILKAADEKAQLAMLRAPNSVIAYLGYHPDNHGVAFVTDKSGKTIWIGPAGAQTTEALEKRAKAGDTK